MTDDDGAVLTKLFFAVVHFFVEVESHLGLVQASTSTCSTLTSKCQTRNRKMNLVNLVKPSKLYLLQQISATPTSKQSLGHYCVGFSPMFIERQVSSQIPKEIDCSSFVMCPLLVAHLCLFLFLFFCWTTNSTNETNKAGGTCH